MAGDSDDWRAFLELRLAKLGVPNAVRDSWRRCVERGVRRGAAERGLRRVSDEDLERRSRASAALLDAALPHVQWLSAAIAADPHVLCVTDAEGIMLYGEGGAVWQQELAAVPGADFSEQAAGTSGIGLALAMGQPAVIAAGQHYLDTLSSLCTLGAPLRGAEGALVGAVGLIMPAEADAARHTALLEYAAFVIECDMLRGPDVVASGTAELLAKRDEELRSAEERRRELMELCGEAILLDVGGRIAYANPAAVALCAASAAADLVGRSVFDFVPPSSHEPFARHIERAQAEAVGVVGQKWGRLDGRTISVEISAERTTWKGGTGIQLRLRDIAERKRTEDALHEASREKDRFLATLSHELRHPLAPIRNAVEVLRSAPGSDAAKTALGVIERQIRQLAMLVDEMLDVARVERGRIALRLERVDLNELLGSILGDYREEFTRHGLALVLEPDRDGPCVHADPGRLSQAFCNLLDNARKFTLRGGRITVAIGRDEHRETAVVRVIDNGLGMSPDALARVFDPYTQSSGRGAGLGLGLALVKGIVEAHGGTVTAESEGVNRGSQFTLRLPLA